MPVSIYPHSRICHTRFYDKETSSHNNNNNNDDDM